MAKQKKTRLIRLLEQLGNGQVPAGRWDEEAGSDDYILSPAVRIRVKGCGNATQVGLAYTVRRVSDARMIGREVSGGGLFEIPVTYDDQVGPALTFDVIS